MTIKEGLNRGAKAAPFSTNIDSALSTSVDCATSDNLYKSSSNMRWLKFRGPGDRSAVTPILGPVCLALPSHPPQHGNADDNPVNGEHREAAGAHPVHKPRHHTVSHDKRDHKANGK